jgi:hypothetical protein
MMVTTFPPFSFISYLSYVHNNIEAQKRDDSDAEDDGEGDDDDEVNHPITVVTTVGVGSVGKDAKKSKEAQQSQQQQQRRHQRGQRLKWYNMLMAAFNGNMHHMKVLIDIILDYSFHPIEGRYLMKLLRPLTMIMMTGRFGL